MAMMHNSASLLPELVDNGVRLLVYAGNAGKLMFRNQYDGQHGHVWSNTAHDLLSSWQLCQWHLCFTSLTTLFDVCADNNRSLYSRYDVQLYGGFLLEFEFFCTVANWCSEIGQRTLGRAASHRVLARIPRKWINPLGDQRGRQDCRGSEKCR